ncbi:hypothetical protein GPECTOR_12g466 [Gonium pectorale]|uniref:Uncharacterized protein n=1 Tax=Gonium pectorale TaxID=33097 RepID=A0A150GNT4_GONPE|nr:hypothetical protein GPECTOR_12g466 [Gonium pectorale]|eukprot:KXZ51503.1 hypothetical protein GPECTOR_12g466 [Gonium pectorale]
MQFGRMCVGKTPFRAVSARLAAGPRASYVGMGNEVPTKRPRRHVSARRAPAIPVASVASAPVPDDNLMYHMEVDFASPDEPLSPMFEAPKPVPRSTYNNEAYETFTPSYPNELAGLFGPPAVAAPAWPYPEDVPAAYANNRDPLVSALLGTLHQERVTHMYLRTQRLCRALVAALLTPIIGQPAAEELAGIFVSAIQTGPGPRIINPFETVSSIQVSAADANDAADIVGNVILTFMTHPAVVHCMTQPDVFTALLQSIVSHAPARSVT